MKDFLNFVFVWFFLQFVLIAAATSMNSLQADSYVCDVSDITPAGAIVIGVLLPLAPWTNSLCWQVSTNNITR